LQPIFYNIPAFDATKDYDFTFSYGGNQPHSNKLTIKNNSTNAVVYEQTVSTMLLKHTLPANSLTNSTTAYVATIQVFDVNSVASDVSEAILFYCFLTPTWQFSNITANQIIHNSQVSPIVTYTQTQSEALDSYQITLYNSSQTEISSTDTIYYVSGDITYTFLGLIDNNTYYLRATGETENHMLLDTGLILITVEYTGSQIYSVLTAENSAKNGYIKLSNNIISITGEAHNTAVYIDDQKIDLTANYVEYTSAFDISDDFILQIDGIGFINYSTILELSNADNDTIEILYFNEILNGQASAKTYLVLYATSDNMTYTTMSNLIDTPLSTDTINIWIKRLDNLYEVTITNISA
jgi:hypothetical protein